jgi:protein TonB
LKKKHILLTAFAVSILLHILVFIFAPELKSEINSNDYLKRITKISIFQEPARPEIVKPESTPRDTMITGSRNPVRKRAPRDNEITESRNDDNSDAPRDNEITESRNDNNSDAPRDNEITESRNDDGGAPRDNEITESRNDDGGGAPRRSGELAVIPKVLNPKTPPYPETLEDEGIEGSVTLELLISKEGKVLKAKVIKSDHELFSESALQAVKSYKFSPGKLKDGSAADSLIEFVIKFEISL